MERLAYAITDHLLRRDVIQKEDYDIYVYGYAVFLEQMCQVIGFILLGIVTKDLLQTALFLGTFYLIRSAFGGYHAETSLVCMLVSYGGWGAVMILSRYMEAYAEVPPRVEYCLTEMGHSLIPHVEALVGWALDHMTMIFEHREQQKGL